MYRVAFFLLFFLTVGLAIAQKSLWSTDPFEHHVFVENKGQFLNIGNSDSRSIKFAWSGNGVSIYFTPTGLCYYHMDLKPESSGERDQEKEEHQGPKKEKGLKGVPQSVRMDWEGADPAAKIIAEDPETYYFTYADLNDKTGKSSIRASGFKKITYKNIYPNIDIVYTFPSAKQGIKYSIILHPGADPSRVKMNYSGSLRQELQHRATC
jgi:hypothetical protein